MQVLDLRAEEMLAGEQGAEHRPQLVRGPLVGAEDLGQRHDHLALRRGVDLAMHEEAIDLAAEEAG